MVTHLFLHQSINRGSGAKPQRCQHDRPHGHVKFIGDRLGPPFYQFSVCDKGFWPGWWFTYPSEKYESVVMMTFPTEWKNKIHVPNHQSVRGSDKVFATVTNIFSVSNAGPWWYEFRADTGLCWGKRLLQWPMIWRFLKIGVRIVTIGIPAAKMTKHLEDNLASSISANSFFY